MASLKSGRCAADLEISPGKREGGYGVMKTEWMNSIVTKFMAGFGAVLLAVLAAFLFVYHQANGLARRLTYEKMYAQAEYYLQSFDNELNHVRRLQNDFFSDRKLTFLLSPDMNIDDYERRDCLLSVKERVYTVTGVSGLVENGILYLPKTKYKILPSGVYNMEGEDQKQMERYLDYADDRIHYDGENFFIVKTGMPRISSDSLPNHVFVILFSREEIIGNLAVVNVSADSGAFWYNEEEKVLVEHANGDAMGSSLLPLLRKEESGAYESVQRLKVQGRDYLVFVGGYGNLGLFVQYELEETVMGPVLQFRNLAFVVLGLLAVLAVLLGTYFALALHQPINTLLKGFQRVQSGNWKEPIEDVRRDEFRHLYQGFNDMEHQIERLINEVYVQTNLTQRAQMKQLQAQIAPHFLYNSFFVLSRRVKRHDYENAELLAKHLGNYFQYLTRNEADDVPLRMEVDHARSYAAIQGTRFVNRIRVEFEETPEKFAGIMVPRLILQPLLENSFEHGLENKVTDGLLKVHFEETEDERRIWVEDNGEDTSEEKLAEIARTLAAGKQGEITGIYNIHQRLQIYFHGHGGIRIQRSHIGGTAVSIYIGKGEEVYESDFVDRG